MDWKDSTSYSRDDKERKPTAWTIDSGSISITVTCGHIAHPGEWVMHCYRIGAQCEPLNVDTEKEAKNKAVETVRERLSLLLSYANLLPIVK